MGQQAQSSDCISWSRFVCEGTNSGRCVDSDVWSHETWISPVLPEGNYPLRLTRWIYFHLNDDRDTRAWRQGTGQNIDVCTLTLNAKQPAQVELACAYSASFFHASTPGAGRSCIHPFFPIDNWQLSSHYDPNILNCHGIRSTIYNNTERMTTGHKCDNSSVLSLSSYERFVSKTKSENHITSHVRGCLDFNVKRCKWSHLLPARTSGWWPPHQTSIKGSK